MQELPCVLFPTARECLACGTRHLDLPGGGFCRNRVCNAAMPEDGTNSRIVTYQPPPQPVTAPRRGRMTR